MTSMTCARHLAVSAFFLSTMLGVLPAFAQTWSNNQVTPYLGDLISVDRTGEPFWPYGFEDLLGDDDTFTAAEQSIDMRTVYATTDATSLWLRVYMSSTTAVGANVVVFVFVNDDANLATGGPVNTDIDPAFTTDPTQGGYEFAFAV